MNKVHRRSFLKHTVQGTVGIMTASSLGCASRSPKQKPIGKRPNILFAISDDQSWPHCSAYGCSFVDTPAFDRIARMGCLFNNAFCAAPQCAPNRASILTGRSIWQNEEAGTHASYFPRKLTVFPDLLEQAGYTLGCTGKAWGPGNWKDAGWSRNPAGPDFSRQRTQPPMQGVNKIDYAANFGEFLQQRSKDRPFFFWYGATEPHRSYEKGIGLKQGKKLEDVVVPAFLPDTPEIRSDLLDYAVECEWFDRHLGRMIHLLEQAGEWENTLIVVTSDNGMPFPRAKANLYEYGLHVPLAVSWPAAVPAGRTIHDLVSFIDYAPTFLEAAGIEIPKCMSGKSFLNRLQEDQEGLVDPARTRIVAGRERHSHARYDNLGYPSRCIRTDRYLYIRNLDPDRWPAGDPPYYYDIDACPTKSFLIDNQHRFPLYFDAAFGKHPLEELYDITTDPACMKNLADRSEYKKIKTQLWRELKRTLSRQHDPRMKGSEIFDSYPRFNSMRKQLGGFYERGKYNRKYK